MNQMSHPSHSVTCEFLDALYSNMFFPLITRPTKITSHSATYWLTLFSSNDFLIDLGMDCLSMTFLTIWPFFSNHFDNLISASNETVFVQDVNQVNRAKFLSHLERIDWSSEYATYYPNKAYNSFFEQYSYGINYDMRGLTVWVSFGYRKEFWSREERKISYIKSISLINPRIMKFVIKITQTNWITH